MTLCPSVRLGPSVPGSSLKGSLLTALFDAVRLNLDRIALGGVIVRVLLNVVGKSDPATDRDKVESEAAIVTLYRVLRPSCG